MSDNAAGSSVKVLVTMAFEKCNEMKCEYTFGTAKYYA